MFCKLVAEGKERVHLVIESTLMEILRHEISINRTSWHRGLLSEEVENAIRNHIVNLRKRRSSMQQAAREQQNARELDNLLELKDKIFEYMTVQTKLWPEGPREHIAEKHLIEAISSIKVVRDRRSQRRWIDRLFRSGLIERTGPKQYIFCELKLLEA